MSSTIWVASSRVGASTSAAGRRPSAAIRSTIGMPKASVLPEPVGDLASTSRPASTSPMTERWIANGSVIPSLASALHDGARHAEIGEGLHWTCKLLGGA